MEIYVHVILDISMLVELSFAHNAMLDASPVLLLAHSVKLAMLIYSELLVVVHASACLHIMIMGQIYNANNVQLLVLNV